MNSASGIPRPIPTFAPVVRPPLTGAAAGVLLGSEEEAPLGGVDVLVGVVEELALVVAWAEFVVDAEAVLGVAVAARRTGKSEDCHITITPFANAHDADGNTL